MQQKGLSLIESAMVLAISATVISGVLYYYNHAKENRELEEGVKQIQTIAATINKLYSHGATRMDNLDNVVKAISIASGISMTNTGNSNAFSSPSGIYTEFWWDTDSNKYVLETQAKSVSSCMSYASLNLGTLMAGKTTVFVGNHPNGDGWDAVNKTKPYNLSPAEASEQCADKIQNGKLPVKIRHILQY